MTCERLGDIALRVVGELRQRIDAREPNSPDIIDGLTGATDSELLDVATEIITQLRVRLEIQHDAMREAVTLITQFQAMLDDRSPQ